MISTVNVYIYIYSCVCGRRSVFAILLHCHMPMIIMQWCYFLLPQTRPITLLANTSPSLISCWMRMMLNFLYKKLGAVQPITLPHLKKCQNKKGKIHSKKGKIFKKKTCLPGGLQPAFGIPAADARSRARKDWLLSSPSTKLLRQFSAGQCKCVPVVSAKFPTMPSSQPGALCPQSEFLS